MLCNRCLVLACVISVVLVASVTPAHTETIEKVYIGNAGNANDIHGAGYGGVDHAYFISKFEVTAGQYTEFLNAVADADAYNLYSTSMWSDSEGCKIQRTGDSDSYEYSVASDRVDRPVNFVSFWDCLRFANWIHNGRPNGLQNAGTTEDGAYTLNGVTGAAINEISHNADAKAWLPTEDEWYKAAFYNSSSGTYYNYATGTDAEPSNDIDVTDPGNNANFKVGTTDYSTGSPFWTTEGGEFENSASPYGTYDQSGNVWEWVETPYQLDPGYYMNPGLRGGAFDEDSSHMLASDRSLCAATNYENSNVGFRMIIIPEPNSIVLTVLGLLCSLCFCKRRPS